VRCFEVVDRQESEERKRWREWVSTSISARLLLAARGSDDGATVEKGKNTVVFCGESNLEKTTLRGRSRVQAYKSLQHLYGSKG
jgi:hypothetical protein